jgi:choline dehydrogenase-like flavoprotein
MASEPALSAVLRATTLKALRSSDTNDVIVVGAGAAGGLAAMLLAEAGLRVLVLDAGPPSTLFRAPVHRLTGRVVRRLSTPEGLSFLPDALIRKSRKILRKFGRRRQPVQSRCYAWEAAPDMFVDDRECPYVTAPERPFIWVRARTLGGRLVIPHHGRQYYRFGPDDFSPRDGLSPPWPLRLNELDPWYALVEHRLRLSGRHDNLPWLPDSTVANVLNPTRSEAALRDRITARWPGARPVLGRYAPPPNTLEAAARTGRLQCRQGAIVREIRVDSSGNVCGVAWIDHQSGSEQQSSAPLVFLCASTLESTRLLMLSRSRRNPQGLGGMSGALGSYLMDHVYVSAEGFGARDAAEPVAEHGRCIYLPRLDSREFSTPKSGRGFGAQIHQVPVGGGRCHFLLNSFGEMLPRQDNRVTLDLNQRDAWGIPVIRIDCAYSQAELARARDQTQALREIAEVAGIKLTGIDRVPFPPGAAFHECGTARMGTDPANSVLDPNNQCWDARGLYVTDGACFPSQGYQNPTLTILALTARACQHALTSTSRKTLPEPKAVPRVLENSTSR